MQWGLWQMQPSPSRAPDSSLSPRAHLPSNHPFIFDLPHSYLSIHPFIHLPIYLLTNLPTHPDRKSTRLNSSH